MSRFMIVQVSKDEDFKMTMEELSFDNTTVIQVPNNKESLAKVYNEQLHIARTEKDVDFVICMHADVALDIKHLMKHVEECQNKYDIIGLCGTSIMNVSQSPLNWWTGSNPTPYAKWGCVTHGEMGNQKSFFSADRKNIRDSEVACIDGLCMIFNQKAIKSGICFDEKFKFDLYDTDISFQAVLKYKLKLGVIVEESLQHFSVGKSILTDEFLLHEIDFRKKWNLKLPENSKIIQLAKSLENTK